jgi:hypothetical protein
MMALKKKITIEGLIRKRACPPVFGKNVAKWNPIAIDGPPFSYPPLLTVLNQRRGGGFGGQLF